MHALRPTVQRQCSMLFWHLHRPKLCVILVWRKTERCRLECWRRFFFYFTPDDLMKPSTSRSQGQLVADFLAGSWRASQARVDFSVSDLEQVTTLLYNSGGTGLAWWRIHESDLKTTQCGELLHQ